MNKTTSFHPALILVLWAKFLPVRLFRPVSLLIVCQNSTLYAYSGSTLIRETRVLNTYLLVKRPNEDLLVTLNQNWVTLLFWEKVVSRSYVILRHGDYWLHHFPQKQKNLLNKLAKFLQNYYAFYIILTANKDSRSVCNLIIQATKYF